MSDYVTAIWGWDEQAKISSLTCSDVLTVNRCSRRPGTSDSA